MLSRKVEAAPCFCTAAHFLIVENGADRNALAWNCPEETFHGGKSALKIVQAASRQELFFQAPDGAFYAVIKEEICTQDILLLHAGVLSHQLHEFSFGGGLTYDRKHILLNVVFVAAVGFAIHVNGQIRDHGKILIQVYQTGLNAILCADCDSSCNREGTVKPRGRKCMPP